MRRRETTSGCPRGAGGARGVAELRPPRSGLALAAWLLLASLAAAQDLAVSVTTPRARLYEGETFDLVVSLEPRGWQVSEQWEYVPGPESAAVELGPFDELPSQSRAVSGGTVTVRRFRSSARALRPGAVQVAPTVRARLVRRRAVLFGSMTEEAVREAAATPLQMQILPLPSAGRPAEWAGAVGRFVLRAEATPSDVAVGDLVTLRMVLEGQGTPGALTGLRSSPGGAFRMYDPRPLPPAPGRWTVEQTLVPLSTNATTIPAVSFCFFDTAADTYRTVRGGPFALSFHAKAAVLDTRYRPAMPEAGGAAPVARAGGRGVAAAARTTLPTIAGVLLFVACVRLASMVVRRRWGSAALAAGAALLAGLLLAGALRAQRLQPAERRLSQAVAVRFAPSQGALALFELAEGTPVSVDAQHRDWLRVRANGDAGWVPSKAVAKP